MSKLTPYIYHGPASGVTLETPEGPKDILLHDGKPYKLPPDNEYIQCLVALKHLEEVKAPEAAPAKKPAKSQTTQEANPNG
jgi:hypothetical protein